MSITKKRTIYRNAYPELFDVVYRYVLYRVPVRQDAEDIVSDVFLNGYRKLEQFDEEKGTLKQWIFGITRNQIKQHWRSRKETVDLEQLFHVSDERATEAFHHLSDKIAVETLLSQLPQETKALLALRYEDQLTYEEIAELLGKQPPAVRKQFSRLHKQLRQTFDESIA